MADNLERQRNGSRFDVDALNERFASSGSRRLLETVIAENPDKRIALVSSFGANSVVLLHLVASIDPSIPVLFIDTGKMFGDTTAYRDEIAAKLGLTNIRVISPQQNVLKAVDPHGALWMSDRDTCCSIRKVQPFAIRRSRITTSGFPGASASRMVNVSLCLSSNWTGQE